MATSRFRLVTLGVCVVAALTVYFWPTTTPGHPAVMTSPQVVASSSGTPPTETPSSAELPPISALVTPTKVTSPASSASPEPDLRPPPPVSHLTLAGNSTTTFTVAWLPSTDAVSYEILLNGLAVGATAGTDATLPWPGDDEDILIQVSALDASSNRSEWRSIVILAPSVSFPTPTSTPTPTATPTPTPTPTPTLTPPPTPTPTSPSVTPTKTKSRTVPTHGKPTTGTAAPDPGPSSSTPSP